MADKHTPGPWHRNIRARGKYPVVFSGRNKHVTVVCQQRNPDETEANIDLVAAAPELLDDLREAWNLVMFLVSHLQGRMGEGALAEMEAKADGWAETILKSTGGA